MRACIAHSIHMDRSCCLSACYDTETTEQIAIKFGIFCDSNLIVVSIGHIESDAKVT